MTIPPEILEQIEKKINHDLGCRRQIELKDGTTLTCEPSFSCDHCYEAIRFRNGAQFGYSLCQKQTPPPTGKDYWIGFNRPEQPFRSGDPYISETPVSLSSTHVREVTDRDQKIAQAVEGLVEAMKYYIENCEPIFYELIGGDGAPTGHLPMPGDWDIANKALSKWEEAKNDC